MFYRVIYKDGKFYSELIVRIIKKNRKPKQPISYKLVGKFVIK